MKQAEIVIEPGRSVKNYWADVWRYRELLYFLSWRDILVRYKQTVVGIAWSVIRPLLAMVVFTFIFGRLASFPSHGVPYPVFVFAAMLPWQFFSNAVTESSHSLVSNANMITKVYFPRLVLPLSSVAVSFVDFLISFAMLFLLMGWYRFYPGIEIFFLPFFALMAFGAAVGAGLWLSALTVKYRDFKHVVPFIVQLGLYLSPVGFSSHIVPENWRLLYALNPLVGIIDGFRWSLLHRAQGLDAAGLAVSCAVIAALLLSGFWYFRKTERTFADVI